MSILVNFDFERRINVKIVVTPRGFAKCGLDNAKKIEEAGFLLEYNDTGIAYTGKEFSEKTIDADGVIVGVETVDREYIDSHPKLKAVVKFGVGSALLYYISFNSSNRLISQRVMFLLVSKSSGY